MSCAAFSAGGARFACRGRHISGIREFAPPASRSKGDTPGIWAGYALNILTRLFPPTPASLLNSRVRWMPMLGRSPHMHQVELRSLPTERLFPQRLSCFCEQISGRLANERVRHADIEGLFQDPYGRFIILLFVQVHVPQIGAGL